MPAPYSQDLRDRILAAYDRGKTTREISETFGVCRAGARRVKQVRRERQRTTRLPMGGVRVVKIDLDILRKLVVRPNFGEPSVPITEQVLQI